VKCIKAYNPEAATRDLLDFLMRFPIVLPSIRVVVLEDHDMWPVERFTVGSTRLRLMR
jgi:hypothetical protein